jgi:magnesium transporter
VVLKFLFAIQNITPNLHSELQNARTQKTPELQYRSFANMSKKKSHHYHRIRAAKRGLPPGALVYTGHRESTLSMVTTLWYSNGQAQQWDRYAPELLPQNQDGIIWVDVRSLSDVAFVSQVGNDFKIHVLAVEDILDTQQRAKLEEYDGGLFLVLSNLHFHADTFELVPEQIAFWGSKQMVLSFQEDPDDTFQQIRQRQAEKVGLVHRKGADYLLYTLADTIVDNYYTVLDDMERVMQAIETEINTTADFGCKERIFLLKRAVNRFRQHVIPLRDAAMRLYRVENEVIEANTRPYLRDLADHTAQILDHIENMREMLANVEALYHAETSNRMNNVMRLLTVISTIFIPLSFVAGVYGMNFDNMPELRWRYGYFIILGLMFSAMMGMLIYFKRKRWI